MVFFYLLIPKGQKGENLDFYRIAIKFQKCCESPSQILREWIGQKRKLGKFTETLTIARTQKKSAPYPPNFGENEKVFLYPKEQGVGGTQFP